MNKPKKIRQLSTAEVSRLLGVSRMEVVRRIQDGRIRAVRVGRSYVIDPKDLPGIHRPITKIEEKKVDEAVERVLREYGDVIRRLGQE